MKKWNEDNQLASSLSSWVMAKSAYKPDYQKYQGKTRLLNDMTLVYMPS